MNNIHRGFHRKKGLMKRIQLPSELIDLITKKPITEGNPPKKVNTKHLLINVLQTVKPSSGVQAVRLMKVATLISDLPEDVFEFVLEDADHKYVKDSLETCQSLTTFSLAMFYEALDKAEEVKKE